MLDVTLFTDPACPFAFSAEPVRQRLRWDYGEQLRWRVVMMALTREPGEAERLAQGAPDLQRRHGMPINPHPYPRCFSSAPACRAVVAARMNAPEYEQPLLRRLRVRTMAGGLLDDPVLIAAAASDVGLDPSVLADRSADRKVQLALGADIAEARNPPPAARALDHRLGGPPGARRYSAPSYVIDGVAIPGFNAWETYETVIANRAPELHRRPPPTTVDEVVRWAPEPLSTAEVALIMCNEIEETRAALSQTARFTPAGADGYWHPRTTAP